MNKHLHNIVINNKNYALLYEFDKAFPDISLYFVSLIQLNNNNHYEIIEVELSYNSFDEAEGLLFKRYENPKQAILDDIDNSLKDYKEGRYKVFNNIDGLMDNLGDNKPKWLKDNETY